jgi:hypothetical protein
VRPADRVFLVEHPLGEPAKETIHSVFEHLAARVRSFCIKGTAEGEEIDLSAAGAVQQKQHVVRSARHELVDKVQPLFVRSWLGWKGDRRQDFLDLRAGFFHPRGEAQLVAEFLDCLVRCKPGGSVAISKRMPPGSRK